MIKPGTRSQRSIRNVNLTLQYHYRYLGLWIVLCLAFMLGMHFFVYLWIQDRFAGVESVISDLHVAYIELQNYVVAGLAFATVVASIGIVALAKLTAHRIAGPYIHLQRTFDSIRDGHLEERLHFRDYDKLDHIAKSFNSMMDAVAKTKHDA
ncbi:MAG: methyl-accepting chemotaxis protein [Verrucomicrobia bacterium]|nr:methyl-accepting chemotaxis protein [Verrucomicrobiota bacterium]